MVYLNTADDEVNIDRDQENYQDNVLSSICILFSENKSCISMDRDSDDFYDDMEFIYIYLIDDDDKTEHLPIPVYSFIKPTMRAQYIFHIYDQ